MNKVFWLPALLLVSAAAYAADDGSLAPTSPGDAKAAAAKPQDEVICKTYPPPVGSLLGARRICHTESEWRTITKDSQDAVNDLQTRARTERLPPGK